MLHFQENRLLNWRVCVLVTKLADNYKLYDELTQLQLCSIVL